jgi:hypothetical protein
MKGLKSEFYHTGQEITYWCGKDKKYKKANIVTAGGGRVKIKENSAEAWIDANIIKK